MLDRRIRPSSIIEGAGKEVEMITANQIILYNNYISKEGGGQKFFEEENTHPYVGKKSSPD